MYVASLFARTPEQIAEEEGLYIEIKRLEQTERRFAKEREELMKTVGGIESGLNVHQPDEEAFSGLFIDPRRKKKKGDSMDVESPSSAGQSLAPTRRVVSAKQAAEGEYRFSITTASLTVRHRYRALHHPRRYHIVHSSFHQNCTHTRAPAFHQVAVPQSEHRPEGDCAPQRTRHFAHAAGYAHQGKHSAPRGIA